MLFHRRSLAPIWVERHCWSCLGGISGWSSGLANYAALLPGRAGPKASSASVLVVERAANTFLIDSPNCFDKTGMGEIRSLGLMPESREEFPTHEKEELGVHSLSWQAGPIAPTFWTCPAFFQGCPPEPWCCDWAVLMVCVKSQPIHGGRRGQKEGHLSFPLELLLSEIGKKLSFLLVLKKASSVSR